MSISIRQLARDNNISFHAARKIVKAREAEQATGKNILVIGDAHVKPDQDLSRFEVLAKFIEQRRPDVIVCIGDFADMASLSSWDKGKGTCEGRRFLADVEAVKRAMDIFMPSVPSGTELHLTLGNHEARITKAANDAPAYQGFVDVEKLGYADYGWQVHDFLKPVTVQGIIFQHYFVSGIMGRPVGGRDIGYSLVQTNYSSCVQGHSHLLAHYCSATTPDGRRMHGLSAGCFFEHDEEYAGPANVMFWRGVCMLHKAVNGEFDLEAVSLRRMRLEAK